MRPSMRGLKRMPGHPLGWLLAISVFGAGALGRWWYSPDSILLADLYSVGTLRLILTSPLEWAATATRIYWMNLPRVEAGRGCERKAVRKTSPSEPRMRWKSRFTAKEC